MLLPFQPILAQLGKAPADDAAEIFNLRSAEWAGGQPLLGAAAMFSGFYANELLLKLLARQDAHPVLFDAYADTLAALGEGENEAPALRAFELVLLREVGWLPELSSATLTAEALRPEGRYTLQAEAGLVAHGDGLIGSTWVALASGRVADRSAARETVLGGVAAGDVIGGAGEGPAVGLVDGEGEDAFVVVEGGLHAVTVVRVDVHIQDVVEAGVDPGQDAQHSVVDVAEACGAVGHAVMGAAAGNVDDAGGGGGEARGVDHPAGGGGGTAEDLAIDRVTVGADAVALAVGGLHGLGFLGADQGRGDGAIDVSGGIEPAEGADEVEGSRDARDGERVLGAVGGVTVDLAANEFGGPPPAQA